MKRLLKRIVKPETIVGKVSGAITSLLGGGTAGILAGVDPVFVIITVLALAAGYLFGWEKENIKSFISFLNEERRKE